MDSGLRKLWQFYKETALMPGSRLYSNSIFLMMNSGAGAVLGFAFWALAAERLKNCPNITLHKTNGWLEMFVDNYFDFVFSSGVFIHFPSKPMVYEYFKEAARVLKPGGVFRFNVDGRNYLRWRRKEGGTIRGVVFDATEIGDNLEKCGFRVQDVSGMNSLAMWATAVLPR